MTYGHSLGMVLTWLLSLRMVQTIEALQIMNSAKCIITLRYHYTIVRLDSFGTLERQIWCYDSIISVLLKLFSPDFEDNSFWTLVRADKYLECNIIGCCCNHSDQSEWRILTLTRMLYRGDSFVCLPVLGGKCWISFERIDQFQWNFQGLLVGPW